MARVFQRATTAPAVHLGLTRAANGHLISGSLGLEVLIAIDELDEIGSVDEVRKLLRSVKGVLDPAGVVLLVSVSDEAVTHLGLGGLLGRDEISSSFGSMIRVPALTRIEAGEMIELVVGSRLPEISDSLWTLAAGNPREIIRLLDYATTKKGPAAVTPDDCVEVSSRLESEELINAVVSDSTMGEGAKENLYSLIRTWVDSGFPPEGELLALWTPEWFAGPNWRPEFNEPWRRYLVRCVLRARLRDALGAGDQEALKQLSEAFKFSQYSASVARACVGIERDSAPTLKVENDKSVLPPLSTIRQRWKKWSTPKWKGLSVSRR